MHRNASVTVSSNQMTRPQGTRSRRSDRDARMLTSPTTRLRCMTRYFVVTSLGRERMISTNRTARKSSAKYRSAESQCAIHVGQWTTSHPPLKNPPDGFPFLGHCNSCEADKTMVSVTSPDARGHHAVEDPMSAHLVEVTTQNAVA